MNYYTYQQRQYGASIQVQEHTTPAEQAEFWQAWHAASDTDELAAYIRDHLNARKAA
jgi:hypothetical protein